MIDFEKIKIYHYMAWKNRGLFLQKIKVFFLKKIEVFFFANRPLQRFNPLTKVYWKIRGSRLSEPFSKAKFRAAFGALPDERTWL